MLARENEEPAQEKMLEQFEQSLKHLDEAGITSIEVLQSVIEEIQAIGNDSSSSISCRNLHPKAIVRRVRRVQRVLGMTQRRMTEDDLEEDLELEIQQNQLVMVNWMLTHRILIIALSRRVLGCLEGCLGAWECVVGGCSGASRIWCWEISWHFLTLISQVLFGENAQVVTQTWVQNKKIYTPYKIFSKTFKSEYP